MIFILDNYDSFTYNLVQYVAGLGEQVEVRRNDEVSAKDVQILAPDKIIISPGPCTPREAGISIDLIRLMAGKLPILGVCLGHQAIGEAFGGKVVRAGKLMHGKTSEIEHDGRGIFQNIPSPMTAARYHSLIVQEKGLPQVLETTAWTTDTSGEKVIMGLRHKQHRIEGVQFHPESILTQQGRRLIANFLRF